jgi:hypothetical protein
MVDLVVVILIVVRPSRQHKRQAGRLYHKQT